MLDADGNSLGYRIGADVIKPVFGQTRTTVNVSLVRRRKAVISTKEKIIGTRPKASNRITFYRDGTELITNSKIDRLFDNAEKETGNRLIYLNNEAFTEHYFFKGDDGKWRFQTYALTELNAPEIEGTVTVRYSYTHHARFAVLQEQVRAITPEKAPQKAFGEVTSTIDLAGRQEQVVILPYR